MSQGYHLLPINSTPLERALVDVALPATFSNDTLPITGIKFDNTPDSWLPWLIYEYGLGEIAPYLPDQRVLLKQGLAFTRIRGTPESLHMALGWVGLDADILESPPSVEWQQDLAQSDYFPHAHFAEYDLVPHDDLTTAQICLMFRLAILAQPVRSRLWRLVKGFDRSVFQLDNSKLSDAYLDDDSGIRPTYDQLPCLQDSMPVDWDKYDIPKLSFASQHSSHAVRDDDNTQVLTGITTAFAYVIYSWQAHMPYLDDLPDPMEVWQISTSGASPSAPATYFGQVWADQPWYAADRWQDTRTIVNTN